MFPNDSHAIWRRGVLRRRRTAPGLRLTAVAALLATSAALSVAGLLLGGCGSGSGEQTFPQTPIPQIPEPGETGRATVTLVWPAPSPGRQVPAAANSVRVTLKRDDGVLVTDRLLTRPPSGSGEVSETFDGLPIGGITVESVAFPNPDGTGTAQARSTASVTVSAGGNSGVRLSLTSTVAELRVRPQAVEVRLGDGVAPRSIVVTAYDAAGAAVLVAVGALRFEPGDTAIVAVDGAGLLTPIATGETTVTVTETGSGKVARATVHVLAALVPAAVALVGSGSDGDVCSPEALNESGEVVGTCSDGDGKTRGFVWSPAAGGPLRLFAGPAGLSNARLHDINDVGLAVGSATAPPSAGETFGVERAIAVDTRAVTDGVGGVELPAASALSTEAFAVNNAGRIVGRAEFADSLGFSPAVTWANLQSEPTRTSGPDQGVRPSDVNESGRAVGTYRAPAGAPGVIAAFSWEGAAAGAPLSLLAASAGGNGLLYAVYANAVNDAGRTVGYARYRRSGGEYALLWDGPTATAVELPGLFPGSPTETRAWDINSADVIVGTATSSLGGPSRAVRWRNGTPEDLNDLLPAGSDWVLEGGVAVNDKGQIVGIGTKNGRRAMFLLTPAE